jgi:hypothetical protein
VIYGRKGGYAEDVDLEKFTPKMGIRILGTVGKDFYVGSWVKNAGDVNGDGIPDILI